MKPLSTFTGILLAFLLLAASSHAKSYSTTLAPEAPGATGGGTAWFEYDSFAHTLAINITFFGLSGTTTIAHIHAATAVAFTGTAAPATQVPTFIGFPTGLQEGEFDLANYDLSAAASYNPNFITANGGTVAGAEAALIAAFDEGKAYLNIHTAPIEPNGPISVVEKFVASFGRFLIVRSRVC